MREMSGSTVRTLGSGRVVVVFPDRGGGGEAIEILGAPGASDDIEGIFVPGSMTRYLVSLGTSRSRVGRILKGRCRSCGLMVTAAFNLPVKSDCLEAGVRRVG